MPDPSACELFLYIIAAVVVGVVILCDYHQ